MNAVLALMQVITIGFLYFAFAAQERALIAQERALHSQQESLTDQVFARLDQQDAEIGRLFLDHPHLRPYFYEGTPLPQGSDKKSVKTRQQVEALADIHLAFIETFDNEYIRRLPGMNYGDKYDKEWTAYFVDLFKKSPALCHRYLEVKDQYSPSMCTRYAKDHCPCKINSGK